MPMLPTRANGQAAFGLYLRESCLLGTPHEPVQARTDVFVPFQLHVLELDGDRSRTWWPSSTPTRSRRPGCRRP